MADTFQDRLGRVMYDKGWSQTALAKQVGCHRSTLNSYLSGKKPPSVAVVCKAADVLGVSTDYLLGRAEKAVYKPEVFTPDQALDFCRHYCMHKDTRLLCGKCLMKKALFERRENDNNGEFI